MRVAILILAAILYKYSNVAPTPPITVPAARAIRITDKIGVEWAQSGGAAATGFQVYCTAAASCAGSTCSTVIVDITPVPCTDSMTLTSYAGCTAAVSTFLSPTTVGLSWACRSRSKTANGYSAYTAPKAFVVVS